MESAINKHSSDLHNRNELPMGTRAVKRQWTLHRWGEPTHRQTFPALRFCDLGVSKNRGTTKSPILIGFSIINHPFWGTPIFGNTHLDDGFCFILASSARYICIAFRGYLGKACSTE